MTKAAEQLYAAFSKDGMVEQYGYSPTGGVHLTVTIDPLNFYVTFDRTMHQCLKR
jgi:hypothetical protein